MGKCCRLCRHDLTMDYFGNPEWSILLSPGNKGRLGWRLLSFRTSLVGTFETCRRMATTSVHRGRAEVECGRLNRRYRPRLCGPTTDTLGCAVSIYCLWYNGLVRELTVVIVARSQSDFTIRPFQRGDAPKARQSTASRLIQIPRNSRRTPTGCSGWQRRILARRSRRTRRLSAHACCTPHSARSRLPASSNR